MANAGRTYESTDGGPDRRVALLLVHGMGEQEPYQLTDLFAVRLSDEYRNRNRSASLAHRVVASEGHTAPQSYIELKVIDESAEDGVSRAIDIHEVYWADRPQGLVKLKELGKWLLGTSLAPLRRWNQHASSYYRKRRGREAEYEFSKRAGAGVFLREVMLALILPLTGVLLFMFAANALSYVDHYVDAVRADFKTIQGAWTEYFGLALFVVLGSAGLFMLIGGLRISRSLVFERTRLNADAAQNQGRWDYLSYWSWGTWLTSFVLLGLAVLAYQPGKIEPLLAAVLRLGSSPPWRVLALAAGLVAAVLIWWWVVKLVWRIPWRPLGFLRVVAAVAVIGGAVIGGWLGYRTVPGDWLQPVRLVFWLTTIAGAWKASGFLVGWIGDVAIYLGGLDNRSQYHSVREGILDLTTAKLASLAELRRGPAPSESPQRCMDPREPYYDEVLVAAHSLGSVIAYDAINRLAVEQRSDSDGVEFKMCREDFDRIKGLFSFGSPLDKVIYFFQRTGSVSEPVRAQILNSLMALRRHSTGRPYGKYKVDEYSAVQPDGFRWHNAWSWGDVLGHRLDHFQINKDMQFHFDYVPLVAHTAFWTDPEFYDKVADWVEL